MTDGTQQILNELLAIRKDIDYLKRHIVDIDIILTEDDIESIKEADEDLKEGRTKEL